MNARFSRLVLSVVLFIVVVLGIVPFAGAQEGPEPVGLRPDAPSYAVHGPCWVGTTEFKEETDFHPTTVQVWYPALNPDAQPEEVTYSQFFLASNETLSWKGHALLDASPDGSGSPYPLVIFAHGLWGTRFMSAYLAEHIASYGFMVMAIDYADSWRSVGAIDSDLSMYTRPKDVSWQIDYADELTSTGGVLEGMIDTQHVAVSGHSYGAYTALMAGGAQLDFSGPTSACVLYANQTSPVETRSVGALCNDEARKLVSVARLNSEAGGTVASMG